MKAWTTAALGAVLLLGGSLGAETLDPGLKKLLDPLKLNYDVTKSGGAAVTFDLDEGRSQQVFLSSSTTELGGGTYREIWSNLGELEANAEDFAALMVDSAQQDLGAWILEETDGGYLAYFSVRVPSGIRPAELRAVLEHVAWVADGFEADWFETDEN